MVEFAVKNVSCRGYCYKTKWYFSGGESAANEEGKGRFGRVPYDHRQDEFNYKIQVYSSVIEHYTQSFIEILSTQVAIHVAFCISHTIYTLKATQHHRIVLPFHEHAYNELINITKQFFTFRLFCYHYRYNKFTVIANLFSWTNITL